MDATDDDLGRDLRAAAGRDLPGEEFDLRVMETIEGGGGERVLSVEPPRLRWRVPGLAAASVLVALGVFAVATGQLRREEPGSADAAEAELAAGIELPVAKTAVPWPRPVRVAITKEGKLRIDGRAVDYDGLLEALVKETRGTHDAGPAKASTRTVVLLADRRVRWREVQWAMQACADPTVRVYRIHFATAGPDGERRVMPAFLPIDRGLGDGGRIEEEVIEDPVIEEVPAPSDEPFAGPDTEKEGLPHLTDRPFDGPFSPRITAELRRQKGEERTEYRLLGRAMTEFEDLVQGIAFIQEKDPGMPLEVNADAEVPFAEVVAVLDAYRRNGRGRVTFVGAPPPVKRR